MVELIEIIEDMGEIAPAEETLEKLISKARNTPYDDQDKPWHIARLAQYDIPPEALPKVLEICVDKLRSEGVHITIREAKWIGKLASVFPPEKKEQLYEAALVYASYEVPSQIFGIDFSDIGDDLLAYEAMTRTSLSLDERDHMRQKLWEAEVKQKLIQRRQSKKKQKEAQDERSHSQEVQE